MPRDLLTSFYRPSVVCEHLPWRWLLGLALVFTLLDCAKPLHIDDAAYYYYARQAAAHPLDPYGFQVFWYDVPNPANHILAPPVLPYWWSLAIHLFGDVPFLWKLWLFPFSLLFVVSLHLLCRQFARGVERPLVVFIVFSPAILPSLNLMLDLPALALTLGAVTLFLRALVQDQATDCPSPEPIVRARSVSDGQPTRRLRSGLGQSGSDKTFLAAALDRGSFVLAAGAGLLAGLGMETKYTAFLAPAIMGLSVLVHHPVLFWRQKDSDAALNELLSRCARCGLAVLVAVGIFLGWELFVAARYGESHFWYALHDNPPAGPLKKLTTLSLPLLTLLGGSTWMLAVLALASVRAPRTLIYLAPLVALVGYGFVGYLDDDWRQAWNELPGVETIRSACGYFEPEDLIYGIQGLLVVALLAVVACRVGRFFSWIRRRQAWWRPGRAEWFLILWFLLEFAGYYALTPFPGVRRIFGPFVVGSLLVGRLASRTCRNPEGRRILWGVTAFGAALGLAVAALDFYEAETIRQAAETGAALARRHDEEANQPPHAIWFVGHWEFQFYGERAGMRPIIASIDPDNPAIQPTGFAEGDWIVLPYTNLGDGGIHAQGYARDRENTSLVDRMVWDDPIPLRSVIFFYGGPWPLAPHRGPRRAIAVYRVTHAHEASP